MALGVEVALAEDARHLSIILSLADQREQDLPGRVLGQKVRQELQVAARVSDGRARVGDGQLPARVFDQGVEQHVHLGWPPAVDRLLGDAGTGGDPLDRDAGEAALDEEVIGGVQHCEARLLITPVWGASLRGACLSWHGSTECSATWRLVTVREDATVRLDKTHRCVYSDAL